MTVLLGVVAVCTTLDSHLKVSVYLVARCQSCAVWRMCLPRVLLSSVNASVSATRLT